MATGEPGALGLNARKSAVGAKKEQGCASVIIHPPMVVVDRAKDLQLKPKTVLLVRQQTQ